MIRLGNGWIIDATECGYHVGQATDYTSPKGVQSTIWKNDGWPNTLNGALNYYIKWLRREKVREFDCDLKTAIKELQEFDRKIIVEIEEYGFKAEEK